MTQRLIYRLRIQRVQAHVRPFYHPPSRGVSFFYPMEKQHKKLGQLASTAICGNDITSSCLYVSALALIAGGRWGPLALLIVGAILYLYRSIYSEVVGALPLNGGAYNALLNTTSKFRASIAACLTILSYMATAVISAKVAMEYVHTMAEGTPVMYATVGLLAFFAILTIIGISESSVVAIGIFIFHLTSLIFLVGVGSFYIFQNGTDLLMVNLATPSPNGPWTAIFLGFCAATLGISGFESSANFVEEQEPGVFPKTLRNMWIAVSVFNPAIALLALAIVPLGDVGLYKESLLAELGMRAGGGWLANLISIDAALVLSGAVLTSFVGVNGLMKRMTLDRCLPQFLLKETSRGTTHRIIISFFLLTVSVLWITQGQLDSLAGVYMLSFLSVMLLFGYGNILLKLRRSKLARPVKASWLTLTIAMSAIAAALIGNARSDPDNLHVFLEYFVPAMLVVVIMLGRVSLLQFALRTTRKTIQAVLKPLVGIVKLSQKNIDSIKSQQMVFFTRGENLSNLNRVIRYIELNEHTNRVKLVNVSNHPEDVPEKLKLDVAFLDEEYPAIDIEFVIMKGEFGPTLISELSKKWDIPVNFMFIGCPTGDMEHSLADLGGVRVVI